MIGGNPSAVSKRDRRSYRILRPLIRTDFADFSRMSVNSSSNTFNQDPNVIDRAKE